MTTNLKIMRAPDTRRPVYNDKAGTAYDEAFEANVTRGATITLGNSESPITTLGLEHFTTLELVARPTKGKKPTPVLQAYSAAELVEDIVAMHSTEDSTGRGIGLDASLWRVASLCEGMAKGNSVPLVGTKGTSDAARTFGIWDQFTLVAKARYHERVGGSKVPLPAAWKSAVSQVTNLLRKGIIPGKAYTFQVPEKLEGGGGYAPANVTVRAVSKTNAAQIWKYSDLDPTGDHGGWSEMADKVAKLGTKRTKGVTVAAATAKINPNYVPPGKDDDPETPVTPAKALAQALTNVVGGVLAARMTRFAKFAAKLDEAEQAAVADMLGEIMAPVPQTDDLRDDAPAESEDLAA